MPARRGTFPLQGKIEISEDILRAICCFSQHPCDNIFLSKSKID
ncbi:hypothetical protein HMPREF1619_05355 [Klebsiella pneumoniae 909957]|nr:hypothetical protein HMPREF1619_05355 [Klebsiella pneumoniae 909957]